MIDRIFTSRVKRGGGALLTAAALSLTGCATYSAYPRTDWEQSGVVVRGDNGELYCQDGLAGIRYAIDAPKPAGSEPDRRIIELGDGSYKLSGIFSNMGTDAVKAVIVNGEFVSTPALRTGGISGGGGQDLLLTYFGDLETAVACVDPEADRSHK